MSRKTKKSKKNKKKKPEIQDFITKVKELRKLDEPIRMIRLVTSDSFQYPSSFEWRSIDYHVEKIIGRWKIQSMDDPYRQDMNVEDGESDSEKNGYRVQLNNGFQVDLINEIENSNWKMIGIEREFFDLIQESQKNSYSGIP